MIQEIISCFVDCAILLWFNRMYEFRKFKKARIVILYSFMLVMIKIFNETGMMSPGIRALVGCIYYFAAIWILYAGMTILHRISRTIVLLLTILVAEFIAMSILLMSIDGVVYETVMDTTVYWFLSLVLTRSCEVIFLNLINKIYFTKTKEISWKEILWHLFFLGSILLYLYIIVKAISIDLTREIVIERTFWANIGFIVLVLIGYYFFWKMYEEQIHQRDLIDQLLQKQQIQLDYYKKVSFYEKEFRKIKHDLKNQLLISESLNDKALIEEYRKEIDNLFSAYETKIHSGNEILDVLLENKIQYCKENNIEFKLNVNFKRGTFIDLIDVGTIFGNIIDNAIEACIRMETGEKKICLFVYESGDFIIIKMENTFDKIKVKGKRLVSLKEDGKNHGIGLYSLEQTLNKYDGSYRYNADNGEFRLTILIPIKASN